MSFILRTWHCLNDECGREFTSGDPSPECPKCRCVKVSWVPGGGHMLSTATKHNDRTVRGIAAQFGLTNLKSARAGEAVHPGIPQGKSLDGMRYGQYGGIKISDKPTCDFAPNPPPIHITGPSDGRHRFRKKGPIPTRITAIDPRKIVL